MPKYGIDLLRGIGRRYRHVLGSSWLANGGTIDTLLVSVHSACVHAVGTKLVTDLTSISGGTVTVSIGTWGTAGTIGPLVGSANVYYNIFGY